MLIDSRKTQRDGVQVVGGSNPLAPTKISRKNSKIETVPLARFFFSQNFLKTFSKTPSKKRVD
jgi:hypothetical protein